MKRKLIVHTCVKILFIFLSVIVVYLQDLRTLWSSVLTYDWATYIPVIPCIITYSLYRKRKTLGALVSSSKASITNNVGGVAVVVFSLSIYTNSVILPFTFYFRMISMVTFIVGGVLLLFGLRVLRALAFPLCYLLFLYPLPIDLLSSIGMNSANITAAVSVQMLKSVGLPATLGGQYEAPVISCQTLSGNLFGVVVGMPCAGVYSLMGFAASAVFLMYVARGPLWKRGVVALIGSIIVYLLNILRVFTIIIVGYYYGQQTALGVFHTFGGAILVLLTTLISFQLSEKTLKIKFFGAKPAASCPQCEGGMERQLSFCQNCGRTFTLPDFKVSNISLALKSTTLLTVGLIFVSTTFPFFTMENVQILTSQSQETRDILPELSEWVPVFSTRFYDQEIESNEDRILLYFYVPRWETQFPPIRVIYEVSAGSVYAHGWQKCIQKEGMDLRSYQSVTLRETTPQVYGYSMVAYSHGMTMVVLEWAERMLFQTERGTEMKTVGVSLIATSEGFAAAGFIDNPEDTQEIVDHLTRIGRAIVENWQPVRELSLLSVYSEALNTFLATFWDAIVTVFSISVISGLAIWAYRGDQKALRLGEVVESLSRGKKIALLAVARTKRPAIGSKIYDRYVELSGEETVKLNRFHGVLGDLERLGLIKKGLVVKDAQTLTVWKSNLAL